MSSSSDDQDYADCAPGDGGYQVAVYKNNNLKILEPLGDESYQYVKSKYKKHRGQQGCGMKGVKKLEKSKSAIVKKRNKKSPAASSSSSSSPPPSQSSAAAAGGGDKPKRTLTQKQKDALARGREKRKQQLAAAASQQQ